MQGGLKLRTKYAEPRKTLTDPSKYYDDSFYREAMRQPDTQTQRLFISSVLIPYTVDRAARAGA